MEKILKIEKNEVLNPEEILLIDKIECPIDSVIPLQYFVASSGKSSQLYTYSHKLCPAVYAVHSCCAVCIPEIQDIASHS